MYIIYYLYMIVEVEHGGSICSAARRIALRKSLLISARLQCAPLRLYLEAVALMTMPNSGVWKTTSAEIW